MLKFETINELTLKVTCKGTEELIIKTGTFIGGENSGYKNYKFEKLLLGPQQDIGQALFGSLKRRVTGENIALTKVMLGGDSITYYANRGQHVVVYQLAPGEVLSIESENILAFTSECKYDIRFIGSGILSQKRACNFYLDRTRTKLLCCYFSRRKSTCIKQYQYWKHACC